MALNCRSQVGNPQKVKIEKPLKEVEQVGL
jgi:hypothetical protein